MKNTSTYNIHITFNKSDEYGFEPKHELVQMEKLIDWDKLIWMAMDLRKQNLKAITGSETF